MAKYIVQETINRYHMVELDDELDISTVLTDACSSKIDETCAAIRNELWRYGEQYGFEYNVIPDYCGSEVSALEVVDKLDD